VACHFYAAHAVRVAAWPADLPEVGITAVPGSALELHVRRVVRSAGIVKKGAKLRHATSAGDMLPRSAL